MARDRKRAKQRRARRPPGPGERRPSRALEEADAPERDELPEGVYEDELHGDDVSDAPVLEPGGRGVPPELEHSSAAIDEAEFAELGLGPLEEERPGRVRDRRPEDETLDEGLAADEALSSSEAAGTAHRRRPRVIAFLGHCIDELRRVQWPTRKYVGQATAVVLGFVIIAGGYLGLLDAVFKPLVDAII